MAAATAAAAWIAGRRLTTAVLASLALALAAFQGSPDVAVLAGLAGGAALMACGAAPGWRGPVAVSLVAWSWAAAVLAGISRPFEAPPGLEWLATRGGRALVWLISWAAAAYLAYNAYAPRSRGVGVPGILAGIPSAAARALSGNPMLAWEALAVAVTVAPAMVEPRLAGPLAVAVLAWLAARLRGVRGPATLTLIYVSAYALAVEAAGLGGLYAYALTQLGLHTPG